MAEESFLMVSLKQSKAKKLAQVISNDTSRKILDYLAKKEATESELAKELSVPISTVHYNMKHLLKANLVQVDEFHYSSKGKEVNHYKLSNKIIIMAPQESALENLREQLKSFLPALLIVAAIGALLQIFPKEKAAGDAMAESAMLMAEAPRAAALAADPTISVWWFVAAAIGGMLVLISANLILSRLRKD